MDSLPLAEGAFGVRLSLPAADSGEGQAARAPRQPAAPVWHFPGNLQARNGTGQSGRASKGYLTGSLRPSF
jgi:hypothetical protein